ncbi:unnamed protein product [Mytilus coruscus]|uniref:Uncharacterized protein n=1 Tax=Mytilus coruscus TaxID=42192 RepID=A0A6J8B7B1_MYTCO|nr:unnamed protein product [Mytilus coruscus]
MAVATLDHIGLKFSATGQKADIPNHPKAKLMYYLYCMCDVLKLDQTEHNIKRFTDYKNYNSLTSEQTHAMILLCNLLDPATLNDVCIFHDEEACGNFGNEFFKIEANRTRIAAARSVMVGNVQVAIQKFMCYKISWIKEYFIEPLRQMIDILQKANRPPQRQILQQQRPNPRQQQPNPRQQQPNPRQQQPNPRQQRQVHLRSSNRRRDCCCSIL